MHTQYLAVDTETTGLNPETSDIIELAAIPLDDMLYPREGVMPYHAFIKPRLSEYIDKQAIKINGHTWVYNIESETYKEAHHPTIAWRLFYDWMKQHYKDMRRIILVGWNVSFDESFLKQLYIFGKSTMPTSLKGKEWPFHYHKMDLITVCRFIDICTQTMRKGYALKKIAKDVCNDKELAEFNAHRALDDISMSLKVFQRMLEESKIPLTYKVENSTRINETLELKIVKTPSS